jgi:hypothetical protein
MSQRLKSLTVMENSARSDFYLAIGANLLDTINGVLGFKLLSGKTVKAVPIMP